MPNITPPTSTSDNTSHTTAASSDLSLDAYHRELIEEGIREADAGLTIPHGEVMKQIEEWKRKAKPQ